ncbi:hypothetical protein D3C73_981840 [compost metagenome]
MIRNGGFLNCFGFELLGYPVENSFNFFDFKGFQAVSVSAVIHRFLGISELGMSAQYDKNSIRRYGFAALYKFQSIHDGHFDIRQYKSRVKRLD